MSILLQDANRNTAALVDYVGAGQEVTMICEGNFNNNARCKVTFEADSQDAAPAFYFRNPGVKLVYIEAGVTAKASVVGGDLTDTSITLTAKPDTA